MCQCKNQSCGCSSCGCSCQSKGGCCSQKSECGCQGKSCGCGGCGGCKCNKAEKFLELADQAWMELLKEKIKTHIQSQAKNMDELARLISEANHERWQKKLEDKECCGSFEEKLKGFFQQVCRTKGKGN